MITIRCTILWCEIFLDDKGAGTEKYVVQVGFEVLTAVTIFWGVTPCSLAQVCLLLASRWLTLQSSRWKKYVPLQLHPRRQYSLISIFQEDTLPFSQMALLH